MRRSFKEHICGYCELKGYKYHIDEQGKSWSLLIEDRIEITPSKKRNWYVTVDRPSGLCCEAAASAWDFVIIFIRQIFEKKVQIGIDI